MQLSAKQRVGLEMQRMLRHTDQRLHPLRTLFWECTLRCNLYCRHCGSDCRVQPEVKDMPAADFLRVIDTLTPHVDPHEVFIIFTGGEALLRDDLEDVGLELYRRQYPWGLVTNGLILGQERLDRLMQSGMHSITVSLDGPREQHNWMRRNPHSFDAASAAINLLRRHNDLLWDVVTCVSPNNYPHLPQLRDYLLSLGVPGWRLFSIFPMGRAARNADLQLSDDRLKGLLDFIEECRADEAISGRMNVSYACEGFLGPYEGKVRDHFFQCRSGVDVASLRCDGAISGCTSVRSHMDQGNIYNGDDLWDVWQNRFEAMRNRKWTKKGQCATCSAWRYCEGSGLHLYDDEGNLLTCHYRRIAGTQ